MRAGTVRTMSVEPVPPEARRSRGSAADPADPVCAGLSLPSPAIDRDPQFRRLWTLGVLVGLIRWVEILAFAVFAYEHTQSEFWVASLMMLRMLPLALFGLAMGALAARVSRRKLMLALHAVVGLFSGGLLLLSVFGQIQVWHLAAASFLGGLLWASDMPLRRGLIGDIAGPARMAQAMSLDSVATSVCRLIGPAVGGLLLAQGGLPAVFICSVLFYLPALLALWSVREPAAPPRAAGQVLVGVLAGGLQAARESPRLRAVLWLTAVFNLFAWPVMSMVPVIGQESLKLDPQGVGLLASVDGVGAVLGSLVLSFGAARLPHGRLYLGAIVTFMVLQMLMAWSPYLLLTAAALLLLGAAQTAFGVMQSTLVYTAAPEHRRAQAMGLMTMCIGASPLGFLAVGALAQRLGAPGATLVCAVCGLLAVALTWPMCRACWREPISAQAQARASALP